MNCAPPTVFAERALALTSYTKILDADHKHGWLALDPGGYGYQLVVALDHPGNDARLMFSGPGCWVPIRGREVWVLLLTSNLTVQADDNTQILIQLAQEPAPLQLMTPFAITTQGVVPASATAPTLSTHGNRIPAGRDYLTIHILDNASTPARIQGAETADIEVWFYDTATGLWSHHPNDDFDAEGRGAALGSHDVEVYHLPNNAGRVYLNNVAGDTLWASLIFTKGQR